MNNNIDSKKFFREMVTDPSALPLIITNIAILFMAVKNNWSPALIIGTYWSQSVVIGIVNVVHIMRLKEYSTEGYLVGNKPVPNNANTKVSTAVFFTFHYGLFHLVYAVLILNSLGLPDLRQLAYNVLPFIATHFFSYFYNSTRSTKIENIGELMFTPYIRIIPMHLTIVVGGFVISLAMMFGGVFSGIAIAVFMLFKTMADLIMHSIHHSSISFMELLKKPGK